MNDRPTPVRGILYLTHRIPYPPDRGDKIRSFHLMEALGRLGPLHIGTFGDDARDMGFEPALAERAVTHKLVLRRQGKLRAGLDAYIGKRPLSVSLFADAALHDYVRQTLATQDISHIVVFSGQMAQYVPRDAGVGQARRFLMDFVDVDSEKFAGYGADAGMNPVMRRVYAREGKLLARYEHAIAARADTSLFVSEAEAALFRTRAGLDGPRVKALENGIDLVLYDPAKSYAAPDHPRLNPAKPLIIFTGQMDYRPNIEAVRIFAENVMPLIRFSSPDAQFAIVGRQPTPEVERLANLPGVIVTGAVDDVKGWLQAANVVVAPLRLARGIQNKVLEAMAMAKAVVASPAAAEGIDAVPNRDLIVADGVEAEAAAVLALIDAPMRARLIGDAARKRMVERYSWDATLASLPQLMGAA